MRPIIRFSSDNAELGAALNDKLLELTLTDNAGINSDALTLVLDDEQGRIAPPRKGVRLRVALGYAEGALVDKGWYEVDEVSNEGWPRTISISARAAQLRDSGIKAPRSRSFDSVTMGDLVRTIAAEHGLVPRVADKYAAEALGHVDQTNESDLNLLTRLAIDRGGVAKPVGGYLLFVERAQAKAASGQAMPVVAIRASQMSQFRVIFPDRGKYGAVMARYHDLALGKQLTVQAGNGEPVLELPVVHASAAEAQNIADSRYRAMQRGQATFTFATVGDPAMQAEAKLMVSGMGERIDGEWIVESVQHRIGGQGYTCTGTATRGVADESDSGDFED